jgi:hypothetical protein
MTSRGILLAGFWGNSKGVVTPPSGMETISSGGELVDLFSQQQSGASGDRTAQYTSGFQFTGILAAVT